MFGGTSLAPVQDLDNLEDMEMDDATSGLPAQQQQQSQAHQNFQPQQQFGRQNQHMPSVNVNMANALQGQQRLRSSTPTTPQAGNQGFPLQHNPTVSSVNTPTFSTGTNQQHNKSSPESSVPGTPAELDQDLSNPYGNFDPKFDPITMKGVNTEWSNNGNFNSNMSNLYIDEPAKRLFSKQGGFNNQHTGFTNGQFGANGELAKRMREQQLMAGMGGNPVGFPGEEIKPFRCPVIGCEKAYKNQNGLKYHKQHGHQNQQLKENPDGTFSIVDPVTSVPYPGTVGMEKEKPYRCEVCGKRYKNLNGLKYHRQHSPPCNPELKLNPAAVPGAPSHISAMNVNVAGAGLLGLGDNNGLF
ncbi:Transcriptional regulator of ribosomal biogenesis proteins [Cryomyces antarcticus]|nr:Transcriptional regulator of ribosomal biogenesis proteins [Cryomyces antarcticus]